MTRQRGTRTTEAQSSVGSFSDNGKKVNRFMNAETAKVTLYVRPDQVVAIEEIQLEQRRRTGRRPDKSALVQEALDLLIQKYSEQG
ncbi:MAG TPA: hypothetical protein VNN73_00680 [Blastocatellia bacterium]|nr:hypothetical protein [Blastocatellia bacterium]